MQKNEAQHRKMTEAPIPGLTMSVAVPTMLTMLVTSIYNLADAFFVSKLGTSASGAVGIVFSLMAIIQAVGFTVGMGAGSTISRLLGEKETETAQKVATCALFASVIFGAALAAAGLFFLEDLTVWLGATEQIRPYAAEYARCILWVAPVMMASFVLNNLLRAEGKTALSMIGIGLGSLLNVALDPLFLFFFEWGIWGAAIATAVSQIVSCAVLFFFFWRKKTMIRLSFRYLSFDFSVYRTFLANGMPSFFRQGLAGIASVTLNRAAAYYGDAAVAAMAIVGKIFMLIYCVLIGFGQGYQPVAGYNYGAGKKERLDAAYRFFMRAGVVGMTISGAVIFWGAPFFMRQFVAEDADVIAIGTRALRLQSAVMPLLPLGIACNMTFQAVGQSVKASFFASCRQGIFFLPLILLLPRAYGILAVEAAQPAADVATFLACVPVMRAFRKKIRKIGGKTEKM